MVLHSKRKKVFIFYSYGKIRPSTHFFPEMFWADIIPIKYVCIYIYAHNTRIYLYTYVNRIEQKFYLCSRKIYLRICLIV